MLPAMRLKLGLESGRELVRFAQAVLSAADSCPDPVLPSLRKVESLLELLVKVVEVPGEALHELTHLLQPCLDAVESPFQLVEALTFGSEAVA